MLENFRMRLYLKAVVFLLFTITIAEAKRKDKDKLCKDICKLMTPPYCNCPNGHVSNWHRRRREAEDGCEGVKLQQEAFINRTTEMVDDLLRAIYEDNSEEKNP